jgi:hypothetical protein
MTAEDELVERELMFNRLRKLIIQFVQGRIERTEFQPWEVEILVDISACDLDRRKWGVTLHHYLKAVGRQLETGSGPPMKLSEYLQRRRMRRPSTQ